MDSKTRILLIMPYGGVGGMERLALTFYKYYKNFGFDVKVIKFVRLSNDIVHFGEDELFFSSHDFYQMSKWQRLWFYAMAPIRIRHILRKHQITHSISFGDMANFFSSLSGTKEHKVGSIHGVKSVEFKNRNLLNRIFKYSYRHSYGNFDKLVCISEAIKEDLLENCGYAFPENLKVIYNPHDIEKIQEMSQESLDSDFEKEIFEKDVVMFLGRFSYQKAQWHLIKSFALLQNLNPDAYLVFIGDGIDGVKIELNRLIEKYDLKEKVVFLGSKKNPYKYLKFAKVLALTSYYEGTPNVIVESLSLNVPVVTSYCTRGIVEMMCLEHTEIGSDAVSVEGGIITPTFYKGDLGIPESDDFIAEEEIFANCLFKVLSDNSYQINIETNKSNLLDKYEIVNVCHDYIN
jgi:glycosyltransferase involved in cell wall biosynthesis